MYVIQVPKKTGGFRTIYVPSKVEKLKLSAIVSGCFLRNFVAQRCPDAHGFMPGRSPITAALLHRAKAMTLSWDLSDFFDSCTPEHLAAEIAYGDTPQEILGWAAEKDVYNTLFIDGAPRQGLPSSPLVSNLCAANLDRRIREFVRSVRGTVYTRYADDLTVSWPTQDLGARDELLRVIPEIVAGERFAVNPKKTEVQYASRGRRIICGVSVGDDPAEPSRATRKLRRRLRAAEHQERLREPDTHRSQQIAGLREWVAQRVPAEHRVRVQARGHAQPLISLMRSEWDLRRKEDRIRLRGVVTGFSVRDFLRAHKYILDSQLSAQSGAERGAQSAIDEADITRWAAGLSATFGAAWLDWVTKPWVNVETGAEVTLLDRIFWLPINVSPADGLGTALLNWRRNIPELGADIAALKSIAAAWATTPPSERCRGYANWKRYAAILVSYPGYVKHLDFARACYDARCSYSDFLEYQDRWIRAQELLVYEAIPIVGVRVGDYEARMLPKSDPRVLWAGDITGCCQHPEGQAESSAWHAAENPEGGVLVITKIDAPEDIRAQGWVWRREDTIVIDSMESKSMISIATITPSLIAKWGLEVLGRLGITEVRIGTARFIHDFPEAWRMLSVPTGCYAADSRTQYIVASIRTDLG